MTEDYNSKLDQLLADNAAKRKSEEEKIANEKHKKMAEEANLETLANTIIEPAMRQFLNMLRAKYVNANLVTGDKRLVLSVSSGSKANAYSSPQLIVEYSHGNRFKLSTTGLPNEYGDKIGVPAVLSVENLDRGKIDQIIFSFINSAIQS